MYINIALAAAAHLQLCSCASASSTSHLHTQWRVSALTHAHTRDVKAPVSNMQLDLTQITCVTFWLYLRDRHWQSCFKVNIHNELQCARCSQKQPFVRQSR